MRGATNQSPVCANTAHSVACFEITPGVSDDFPARRVIRCLDSHDFGYEIGVFLLGEHDELVFGRGRSDNKDRVDAIESSCDVVKETPGIVGVLARFAAAFR